MKKLNLALIILLATVCVTAALSNKQPNFQLESLDGKQQYSPDSFKGKLLFLTFFEKSCVACKGEVPFLNQLALKYPDTLAVVGVGFNEQNPANIKALAAAWGMKYTVVKDPGGVAAKMMNVGDTLPRGYLLNERSIVIAEFTGINEKSKQEILAKIGVLSQNMRDKKTKGPSFWVVPELKVEEGDKALGKKYADKTRQTLAACGKRVAVDKDIADYVIEGNVLAFEGVVAVELIVRDINNNVVTKFSVDVAEGEDILRSTLESRLKNLK